MNAPNMRTSTVNSSGKSIAPNRPHIQRGLTLLEVMVALLIFALTGTVEGIN